MELFTSAGNSADGLRLLDQMRVFQPVKERCKIAVSSVDVSTGVTAIFCDQLQSSAWNLKVYPLSNHVREALKAAICPFGEGEPLNWEQMQLCDFSARYGCPFFPLRMAGMERLLAVCFSGGDSPAQIAADSLSALTGKNADFYCAIHSKDTKDPRIIAQENLEAIYQSLLF